MQKNPVQVVRQHKAKLEETLVRRMVSPNEAASLFSVATGTLGNWRSARKGPRFFKVGHKILYKVEDLETFFTSTPVLTIDSMGEAG